MKANEVTAKDVVQIVVHGAAFPQIADWCDKNEFELAEYPPEGEDDLPTFILVPSETRMRRFTGNDAN